MKNQIARLFNMTEDPILKYNGIVLEDKYTPSFCGMEFEETYIVTVEGNRKPIVLSSTNKDEQKLKVSISDDSIS